jgi:hypothetical protein
VAVVVVVGFAHQADACTRTSPRLDHVFREPFPQQLSADQQRWSSIEMVPSSSTSSGPAEPADTPNGPPMAFPQFYSGSQQQPQYQQEGSEAMTLSESEEQQIMGQQGASNHWQRWYAFGNGTHWIGMIVDQPLIRQASTLVPVPHAQGQHLSNTDFY